MKGPRAKASEERRPIDDASEIALHLGVVLGSKDRTVGEREGGIGTRIDVSVVIRNDIKGRGKILPDTTSARKITSSNSPCSECFLVEHGVVSCLSILVE